MVKNVAAVVSGVLVAHFLPLVINTVYPDLYRLIPFGRFGWLFLNFLYALVGGYVALRVAKSSDLRLALTVGLFLAIPNFINVLNYGMDYAILMSGFATANICGAMVGGYFYSPKSNQPLSRSLFNLGMSPSLSNTNSIYGGVSVNMKNSEATRYLAASALQNGSSFRNQILNYMKQKYKAFAPELGYDLQTVVRLCKYFEERETKYHVIFFFLAILFLFTFVTPIAPLLFVIAWIIRFYKGNTEHKLLLENFQKEKFDADEITKKFNAYVDEKQIQAIDSENQGLVIYNGFSPFVGSGINMGGWSFAVDVSVPKEELGENMEVQPFTLAELYNAINHACKELKFDGLKIKNVLFVNGSDIRKESWILSTMYSTPNTKIDDNKIIYKYAADNDSRIRYYKWIQVYDWGNELVVSYFLRYSRRGNKLFVEVSTFLLTPLADSYKKVDKLVPLDFTSFIGEGVKYLFLTPFTAAYSVLVIFGKFSTFIDKLFGLEDRRLKKMIKNNPLFNYGADRTLRQGFSSPNYIHYFQLLDKEMYSKIIERQLLDTFISFLDEHNVDTSDLKERQTSIINQGVIVKGGDVKAESMAVGTGAKAQKVFNKTFSAMRKK